MRFFLLCVFLFSVATASLLLGQASPVTPPSSPSTTPIIPPSPTPPAQSTDVAHNGKLYRIAWMIVADPSRLTLIPNFTQKRTARSFIDANECAAVVNAGFYTKDNQPTGLFIANDETTRGNVPNNLFNGYFIIDHANTASISLSPPNAQVRIALQSGPLLLRDGDALPFTIRDDEFARRVVVAVNTHGGVVFLVLYDPENPYKGPKLADIPRLLAQIAERLELRDALNLDGGSASAFMRNDVSLEELTSVGSFFCIR